MSEQGELWSADPEGWARDAESRLRPLYEAVLERLAPGPGVRLLDAGCGAGLFASLAAERGAEVHGLDAAPGLVDYARRRVPDAEFVVGDIGQLRSPIGSSTLWRRSTRCCTRPIRRSRWPNWRA